MCIRDRNFLFEGLILREKDFREKVASLNTEAVSYTHLDVYKRQHKISNQIPDIKTFGNFLYLLKYKNNEFRFATS